MMLFVLAGCGPVSEPWSEPWSLVVPDGGSITFHLSTVKAWEGEVIEGHVCASDANGIYVVEETVVLLRGDGLVFYSTQTAEAEAEEQGVSDEVTLKVDDQGCAAFTVEGTVGAGTVALQARSGSVKSDPLNIEIMDVADFLELSATPGTLFLVEGAGEVSVQAEVYLSDGRPAEGIQISWEASAGSLAESLSRTDSAGRAKVTWRFEGQDESGSATVDASALGPDPAESVDATVTVTLEVEPQEEG